MTLSFRLRVILISILAPVSLSALCAGSVASAQAPREPETVVLPAVPLGNVTLSHKAHVKEYGAKCDACHHASKPEKALKAPQQKCGDCHTKVPAAPMKTKLQGAFHNPVAKSGTCIDCHAKAAAKGNTKVPAKCADCHKKA